MNVLSEQSGMMSRGMKNLCELKVRGYDIHIGERNEYLTVFTRGNASANICDMELNETLLNIMQTGCIMQGNVQGFDCKKITF